MRVRTITYAMLRKERQFENDRAEVTIDLEPGDEIDSAIAEVKWVCARALDAATPRGPRGDRSAGSREYKPDPKNERPIEPYGDDGNDFRRGAR